MSEKSGDLHRKSTLPDPDEAPELDEEFFARGEWRVGEQRVSPTEGRRAAGKALRRGRPRKANPKVPIHIRFSPEVVAWFRATGKGWQTRMDEALKEWIAQRERHSGP